MIIIFLYKETERGFNLPKGKSAKLLHSVLALRRAWRRCCVGRGEKEELHEIELELEIADRSSSTVVGAEAQKPAV